MNDSCSVYQYLTLLMIFVILGYIGGLVKDMRDLLEAEYYQRHAIVVPAGTDESLPDRCREYYNDGTDDWVTCMGVGYVDRD